MADLYFGCVALLGWGIPYSTKSPFIHVDVSYLGIFGLCGYFLLSVFCTEGMNFFTHTSVGWTIDVIV